MRILILSLIQLFCVMATHSQYKNISHDNIVNGYERKVSGDDYSYHSSIPIAKESLIVRATDGNSCMEWETSIVPEKSQAEFLSFVWLAGLGSSPGQASFDLTVNGEKLFTFYADGKHEFQLFNQDGASLSFKKDMIDQHGDHFGFMCLRLPYNSLSAGSPLKILVRGGRHNLTSWYMTFCFPLKSGLEFKSLPAIFTEDKKQYQLGIAGVLHFGEPSEARIFIDNQLVKDTIIGFGYNYLKVKLPIVTEKKVVSYRLELAGKSFDGEIEIKPVKEWRVNFVQHSHTDIGYTRSQTEILAEHLRFIDYALDYCDLTDSLPNAAKFRWTCESAWAVDEFLRSRPKSQIARLKKRVEEGRIEITAMYFNFDELPDEQTLAASLSPLKELRKLGLQVTTAMQNDVNGIAWCLNDFYKDIGVRYLNMGTHGHRALICFDKPTLFWWESPSGNRMLAFRAEHYMIGNTRFKIHGGDFNAFEDELLNYLNELDAKGYEYSLVSLQHSGYITDNSPPSTLACQLIKQWNEKYEWPKLTTATTTAFFEEMERDYGNSFPVIRGAWPDWWTDGFGASAREVAAVRQAQTDLIANCAGLTMAAIQGSTFPEKITDRINATNSALLFYTEHTVGYHASVREPFHRNTMEQRALKESYAWEAGRRAKMLGEESLGLLQSFLSREKLPSIVVYNTLNWARSGLANIYIDHQILPRYTDFIITDFSGKQIPAQPLEHHSDGTYWALWLDSIPAFGYKKFFISLTPEKTLPETVTGYEAVLKVYENEWYKIKFDTERAVFTSLYDKDLQLELIDEDAEWLPGQFVYETPANRQQMESFRLDNFSRSAPDTMWMESFEKGAVWDALKFAGSTKAAAGEGKLKVEIRIYKVSKRIELVYNLDKKLNTEPEGIYIAFPFKLEQGKLSFDVQGGEILAGIDQIKGSSNDWNTVQNYALLSNEMCQVVLCSPEAPLMQFGGINTGRYRAGATPSTAHIYGWPMNNYWTTNFNADQHGGHVWSYILTSNKKDSVNMAVKFGWGNRVPFLTRVLPGGGKGGNKNHASFLHGWPENVLLVSCSPEQNAASAVFHVRETKGKNCNFMVYNSLTNKRVKCTQVDVNGVPLKQGSNILRPYETKFFRIVWK